MKKFTSGRVLMICAFAVFMASCATTPKTSGSQNQNDDDISISEGVSTTEAKVRREPKPISVQNTSNQLEKSFKAKLDELEIKAALTGLHLMGGVFNCKKMNINNCKQYGIKEESAGQYDYGNIEFHNNGRNLYKDGFTE